MLRPPPTAQALDHRHGRHRDRRQRIEVRVHPRLVGDAVLPDAKAVNWPMSVPATNAWPPAPRKDDSAELPRIGESQADRVRARRTSPASSRCAPRAGRRRCRPIAPSRPKRTDPSLIRRTLRPRAAPRGGCRGRARPAPPRCARPRSGGGAARAAGVCESFTGKPSVLTGPSTGWSISITIPRAAAWSLAATSAYVVDRAGRDAGSEEGVDPVVAVPRAAKICSSSAISTSRFASRSRLSAKRGSSCRSGRPSTSQKARHSFLLAAPITKWPSAARTAWYGALIRLAVPSGPRRAAGGPVLGGLPDRERERRLEQRGVDVLAAARLLSRPIIALRMP